MGRASAVSQPPGWDEDLKIAPAQDLNPDPHVLEVNLEAKPAELRDRARQEDDRVDVQRPAAGAVDPRAGRRPRDRALQELAARGDDDPLARPARARTRWTASPGITQAPIEPGGEFRLRVRAARTRARTGITRTSIPPCAGRARALRRDPRRGSEGSEGLRRRPRAACSRT